jgi:hypothetical protein
MSVELTKVCASERVSACSFPLLPVSKARSLVNITFHSFLFPLVSSFYAVICLFTLSSLALSCSGPGPGFFRFVVHPRIDRADFEPISRLRVYIKPASSFRFNIESKPLLRDSLHLVFSCELSTLSLCRQQSKSQKSARDRYSLPNRPARSCSSLSGIALLVQHFFKRPPVWPSPVPPGTSSSPSAYNND